MYLFICLFIFKLINFFITLLPQQLEQGIVANVDATMYASKSNFWHYEALSTYVSQLFDATFIFWNVFFILASTMSSLSWPFFSMFRMPLFMLVIVVVNTLSHLRKTLSFQMPFWLLSMIQVPSPFIGGLQSLNMVGEDEEQCICKVPRNFN